MSNLTIEVKNDAMLGRLTERTLHIELIKKDKEIERLNNIINELEKWLRNEMNRLDEIQETYDKYGKKKDPNIIYISGAYNEVLDKLQELKGDGSNEKTNS